MCSFEVPSLHLDLNCFLFGVWCYLRFVDSASICGAYHAPKLRTICLAAVLFVSEKLSEYLREFGRSTGISEHNGGKQNHGPCPSVLVF